MSATPEKTTNARKPAPPATFEKVLSEGLEQIDNRRDRLDLGASSSSEDACPLERARKRRLVGLSFSGGDLRSATFNLGVLQGLAGLGLLRFTDYLPTVSGGGYSGRLPG